jgi:branched-chain amino acid transport system ATP-binding protein
LRFAPLRFRWRAEEGRVRDRAVALLDDFDLLAKRRDFAATLSGGQRKLLEMARALMAEPQLLMLDEPMAGVNPALVQSLLDHVRRLRDAGLTIVFVEHDMDVVMSISDWVVCLAEGKVIAEGRPRDIVANHDVIEAYLGHRRARPA